MERFWLLQLLRGWPDFTIPEMEDWFWSEVNRLSAESHIVFEYEWIEEVFYFALLHCRSEGYTTLEEVEEDEDLKPLIKFYLEIHLEEPFQTVVGEPVVWGDEDDVNEQVNDPDGHEDEDEEEPEEEEDEDEPEDPEEYDWNYDNDYLAEDWDSLGYYRIRD